MIPDALNKTEPELPDWFSRLEARVGKRGYLLLCSLVIFLILQLLCLPVSLIKFLSSGDFDIAGNIQRFRDSFLPMSSHPFSALTPDYPQCRLRVLGPLIAWLLQLRGPSSAIVTWIAGLPALFVAMNLARQHLNARLAVAFTLILATIHPFIVGNSWLGFQDTIVGMLLMLALTYRPWWCLIPVMFLGMLADERCIAAGGLILCWHWYFDKPEAAVRQMILRVFSMFSAGMLWLAYGMWQLNYLNMTTSEMSAAALDSPLRFIDNIPSSFYLAFKGAWAIAFLGMILLFLHQRRGFAIVIFLMILPVLACSLTVGDTSRVVSNALPVIFIGMVMIARYWKDWLTPVLITILMVNLISPSQTGVAHEIRGYNTAPMTVLLRISKKFYHRDP